MVTFSAAFLEAPANLNISAFASFAAVTSALASVSVSDRPVSFLSGALLVCPPLKLGSSGTAVCSAAAGTVTDLSGETGFVASVPEHPVASSAVVDRDNPMILRLSATVSFRVLNAVPIERSASVTGVLF